jgi:hypothetical protein
MSSEYSRALVFFYDAQVPYFTGPVPGIGETAASQGEPSYARCSQLGFSYHNALSTTIDLHQARL